jgi:tRNA A-37 threonylcarbamoyl transferase component Bud32
MTTSKPNAGFDRQAFAGVLTELSRGKLPAGWHWVKSSVTAVVAHNPGAGIYYKEFLPRNRWESLKARLRGSRCERAVTMAEALAKRGFHTPAVLASGNIDAHRDYLLTESVDAAGIASYFASYLRNSGSAATLAWKRRLIRALGREIGRMHSQGIIHGDLRPNNVLIEFAQPTPTFHFIDNERSRCWPRQPAQKLIDKNLIQIGMLYPLDISRSDRLRFFRAYQSEYPRFAESPAAVQLMTRVYRATRRRLHDTPHYRPHQPDLPAAAMSQGRVVPPTA